MPVCASILCRAWEANSVVKFSALLGALVFRLPGVLFGVILVKFGVFNVSKPG
jgi:hypothetical protein